MQFSGYYLIAIPPEGVWAALNNPDVLRGCLPGCDTLEKIDERRFAGSGKFTVGPVDAAFEGNVEIVEQDMPRRWVLQGDGQGAAGSVNGHAEILLAPEGEGTAITFTATAAFGGELAGIDQQLIEDAAQQIADDFFARFSVEAMTTPIIPTLEQPDIALATPPKVQESSPEAQPREGVGPEIWVVGLIAIIVILLILFSLVL
jgi:uncharacterized protein